MCMRVKAETDDSRRRFPIWEPVLGYADRKVRSRAFRFPEDSFRSLLGAQIPHFLKAVEENQMFPQNLGRFNIHVLWQRVLARF